MHDNNSFLPRLQARYGTDFTTLVRNLAFVAVLILGIVALIGAFRYGKSVLVPVSISIVIGMMLGPYADRMERFGMAASLSAAIVVVSFIFLIIAFATAIAVPLADWIDRLPLIWRRIREIVADWEGVLNSAAALGDQLRELTGEGGQMKVTVDEGNPATSLAFFAPALVAQFLIFLASLYFFLACRHEIRVSILRLCLSRRLRWQMARLFRDIENLVSNYLISITFINLGLGASVALVMALLGMPSPLLWGMIAALLNYIPYIGPAVMMAILLGVGLAVFDTPLWMFLPLGAFIVLNLAESQFVTPQILGMRLTLNPFAVFLGLVFWLWLWGPAGGFVAVPFLLVGSAAIDRLIRGDPPAASVRRQG